MKKPTIAELEEIMDSNKDYVIESKPDGSIEAVEKSEHEGKLSIKDFMKKIEVKFIKTHPDAILPTYNHYGEDAGLDIYSIEDTIIPFKGSKVIDIGLKLGYITPGYWFKIETRSGLGFKAGLHTHHGVIDCGYKGILSTKLYNFSNDAFEVKKGDKIAQLVFYPLIVATPSFIEESIESKRGEKGLGSSDERL